MTDTRFSYTAHLGPSEAAKSKADAIARMKARKLERDREFEARESQRSTNTAATGKGPKKLEIARMHPAVLLAGLTDKQIADLAPKLAAEVARKNASRERKEGAATARAVAVMSSEHVAGRTKLAADLLANEKLSADDIIAILAASGGGDRPDAAAEMRQVLAEMAERNGASAAIGERRQGSAAAIWDRAYAKIAGEIGQ